MKEVWKQSVNADSSMVRQIGAFRRVACNGEEVIGTNNTKVKTSPHVASKLSGVTNPNQVIIVPTFFRGDLCAFLHFTVDAYAVKDPANVSAILHDAMFGQKKEVFVMEHATSEARH